MQSFLSTAQVAATLGLHPTTVQRFVKEGRLHALRFTPTSPLRFRPEDVAAFLRQAGAPESEVAA